MRLKIFLGVVLASLIAVGVVAADPKNDFQVKPGEFKPEKTPLVNGAWLNSLGCPTNAKTAVYNSTFTDTNPGTPYTDPACPTGDDKDKKVEGLLLNKTGPTTNAAAAGAEIKGLKKDTVLTELGWDIRKPGTTGDARGSHCGAGSPRWNIIARDSSGNENFFFIGCNSPPPSTQTNGGGFIRERWGGGSNPVLAAPAGPGLCPGPAPAGTCNLTGLQVKFIEIVMDEGQDTGPDNFGLAILDNIDINGTLVGRGPTDPS
jgi:hypothetical protein